MRHFFRRTAAYLLLACLAAGCSTPGKRARQHPADFGRLSPADQKLVLGGHVRPGLSQQGVYIAWGEPDQKVAGTVNGKDGAATETWIYRQRVTLQEPMNSYDSFGPGHGYGLWPTAPWLRPGYGAGGTDNEGVLQYQPHVRSLDTLRVAEFSTGKVDRYKEAGNPRVASAVAMTALTPRHFGGPTSRVAGKHPQRVHRKSRASRLRHTHRNSARTHHQRAA